MGTSASSFIVWKTWDFCEIQFLHALSMKPTIFPGSAPVTWGGYKSEEQAECRAWGVGIFEDIIFN